MRSLRLAACLVAVAACGLIKFDVEQPIPEQMVPGSPLGAALPVAGLFSVPLQVDIDGSVKSHGAGAASGAYLKTVTLSITAPAGETFAFLDRVSLSIAGPGQPDKEIATLSPVPAQGTITLAPAARVNLLPYIKAGTATITAKAGGHLPAKDVKFDGKVVITIEI
jgi:hypothetical protein